MISLSATVKAVEESLGEKPHVLFGENAYYECISVAEKGSHAASIETATQQDLARADLLILQFNPSLRLQNQSGSRL